MTPPREGMARVDDLDGLGALARQAWSVEVEHPHAHASSTAARKRRAMV